MNLNQLSTESNRVTGSFTGFIIKSLAHPDRKFRVESKLSTGKFAITRLDTNSSYLVLGTEDRYEFAIPMGRILEVKTQVAELEEQAASIATRLITLKEELGTYSCELAG